MLLRESSDEAGTSQSYHKTIEALERIKRELLEKIEVIRRRIAELRNNLPQYVHRYHIPRLQQKGIELMINDLCGTTQCSKKQNSGKEEQKESIKKSQLTRTEQSSTN